MANLIYKRLSTDQQSTARQNLVLDEAGIEDPVVLEEDTGTSNRPHSLQRPKFSALLTYARPGDSMSLTEVGTGPHLRCCGPGTARTLRALAGDHHAGRRKWPPPRDRPGGRGAPARCGTPRTPVGPRASVRATCPSPRGLPPPHEQQRHGRAGGCPGAPCARVSEPDGGA